MIDWVQLIFCAVWITGIAILIGQFSFHSWQNSTQAGQKPLTNIGKSIIIAGILMTGVGLAVVSTIAIQRLLWIGLTITLITLTYRDLEKKSLSSE